MLGTAGACGLTVDPKVFEQCYGGVFRAGTAGGPGAILAGSVL